MGVSHAAKRMTNRPPMGSTMPESEPMRKERQRLLPAARMGMEMIAPSGMFWMAIPSETAMAADKESPAVPCVAPAGRLRLPFLRAGCES